MPVYINFEDPIKGDVQGGKYEDWIRVESVSFGVSRPVYQHGSSPGKDRMPGSATGGEISFSRIYDAASPQLYLDCVDNDQKTRGKCNIVFVFTGDEQPMCEITLEQVLLTSWQFSGAGEGRPMESFSLSYTGLKQVYNEFMGDKVEAGDEKGFDFVSQAEAAG